MKLLTLSLFCAVSAALAADAPTPSAAAELVARDSGDLIRELRQINSRLEKALRGRLVLLKEAVHMKARIEGSFLPRVQSMRSTLRAFRQSAAMQRPLLRVNEERQRLDELHQRAVRALQSRLRDNDGRSARLAAQLAALNPRAILSRGYSITMDAATGQVLRSADTAQPGMPLRIYLHEGQIDAFVGGNDHKAPMAAPSLSASVPAPAPGKPRRPRRATSNALPPADDLFAGLVTPPDNPSTDPTV